MKKKLVRLFTVVSLVCIWAHLGAAVRIVSFDESMQRNSTFSAKYAKKDVTWCFFKSLYQTYALQPHTGQAYLIPKKIHLIWLGSPLPERCKRMVDSWKKFHPAWDVKIWTDNDVAAFKMQNQLAFDRAKNYGEKSDIWRYEILYRFGGLYVDTDFECLVPFDDLHKSTGFYAGLGYIKDPLLYNGLIGCSEKHPIMKLCMDQIIAGPGNHDPSRIMKDTGPWHFTRCFQSLAGQFVGKIVAFPVTYFYAFPNNQRFALTDPQAIKNTYLLPESMALHYWATSWWVKDEGRRMKEKGTTMTQSVRVSSHSIERLESIAKKAPLIFFNAKTQRRKEYCPSLRLCVFALKFLFRIWRNRPFHFLLSSAAHFISFFILLTNLCLYAEDFYIVPYDSSVLDSRVCTYSPEIPPNALTTWQLIDKRIKSAGLSLKVSDLSEISHRKSSATIIQNAKKVIFVNLPTWTGKNWGKKLVKMPREKLVLIALEPPSVLPEMYHYLYCFGKVLTWDDALVDNVKFFKINYQVLQDMIPNIPSFAEKKLLTTICRNKRSSHPNELYTERFNVICYFEARHGNDFEFYGTGWEKHFRNYRGEVTNKLETLKKYRFSICYENIKNVKGYITEKIFDCFAAGCVPIYLGASNIKEYIPANCFIARENFATFDALMNHIRNMKEAEYNQYLVNIRAFLKSEKAQKFSKQAFADAVTRALGV